MTIDAIIIMIGAMLAIWGVAIYAFLESSRSHGERLRLLASQGSFEAYSSKALAELKDWIERNPRSEHRAEAVNAYNDTIRQLKSQQESFYTWDKAEIERLKEI